MLDLNKFFQYQRPNVNKLKAFGFTKQGENYEIRQAILNNSFEFLLIIGKNFSDYQVFDKATKEEYLLIKTSHSGRFVGEMTEECEKFLAEVLQNCFEQDIFKEDKTKKLVTWIEHEYQVTPEFPWEKSPDYAVFRHENNQKWFALLMVLSGVKLSPELPQKIEVLNLKGKPEKILQRIDNKHIFKGYHMNKKYWYSVYLNDDLPDEILFELLKESFLLTQ